MLSALSTIWFFNKYSSVTAMFLQLGLPTFNTSLDNHVFTFTNRMKTPTNV